MKQAESYFIALFLATALLFSVGCSTLRRGTDPAAGSAKPARKAELSDKDAVTLARLFYTAIKEKMIGNHDIAANLFSQCIRMDPDHDASLYELAAIYNNQGKYQDALPLVRKAAGLKPENDWYQLLLAKAYQNNKMHDEAVKVFSQLAKQHPEKADYQFELASAMIHAGKLQDAVEIYERLEQKYGVNEEIIVRKEQLYLRMGKLEEAIGEVQKLIAAWPKEGRYYGMLAELYFANGMDREALETFEKLREVDPGNDMVHLSLADYYRSTGEKEKSLAELTKAFRQPNLDIDTKVKILLSFYSATEDGNDLKESAMDLCRILIEVHPQEAKAYAIYGDFLYREKKLNEARDMFRRAIELDAERYAIWSQLLLIESELQDFEAMAKESTSALELFPNQPFLHLLNGVALIQIKENGKAVEVLRQGTGLAADNHQMQAQMYSNLGDAYHNLGDHANSDRSYEKALELEPNSQYVLNNYSYYLALRGDSLEKAERMSKKANELDPGNTSFQDTYGWVMFRLGRYKEAEKWLKKAMESGAAANPTVLEHYGDVLFKLNRIDEALDHWDKARQAGKGSDLLDRKIADRMFYDH